MPLTTALYTGMSGLNANQTALDVIGNNIANVNTTAFKGSRAVFQPEYSETYSFGTAPGDTTGGTNASQKGLGVRVGTIQRNFSSGNVKLTGVATDMAIDGDGLFVVEDSERYFTRTGHFELNADNYLITSDGKYVMGYDVDENYNIIEGSLEQIRIPMNQVTVARATSTVVMDGQLGGDDIEAATQGTILASDGLTDSAAAGGVVTGSSLLTDLLGEDGTQRFYADTTINFEGIRGDGRLQGPKTLDVTAATTVDELMSFMTNAFGVDESTANPAGVEQPGASVIDNGDGTYSIQIAGNVGEDNKLQMGTGGLFVTDTADPTVSVAVPGPLIFQTTQEATGTSVFTSMDVYDSLGNPIKVDLTFVFESESNSGRTWRFFANSLDDTDVSSALGSGTISFDTVGNYLSSDNTTLRIDQDGGGVQTPLSVTLDLSRVGGVVKDSELGVQLSTQDGEPAGTLTEYSIASDGTIIGSFNNGATRNLGQLALATFSNYGGLIDAGENCYKIGPNSGEAIIGIPQTNGAGSVVGMAIETSNVDISREFVELITASTGFSAASRVITTSNDLLTELLSIVR